jgi:TPR repeat protein
MNTKYIAILIPVIIFFVMACSNKKDEPPSNDIGVVSGNSSLYLTPKQLVVMKNLADKGDGEAALKLASYCIFIEGNNEKAFLWIKKSAEHGYVSGMRELAKKYLAKSDKKNALYWFKLAANKGDSESKEYLEIFFMPEELEKVSVKAMKGDGYDAYRLYRYYSIISLNEKKEKFWIKKAAENGYAKAQFIYAQDCSQDKEIFWIKKAAENGYPQAQFVYAAYYCQGKERMIWLEKSAANGNVQAKDLLEKEKRGK